jgi:hypothetical protein
MHWNKKMEKITLEKCKTLLKERFPKAIPYLEAESALYGDQGMMVLFSPFSRYAEDMLRVNNAIEAKTIFDFIEFLLCNGDDTVKDGAATCFLEHLFNIDATGIKFRTFRRYLGENSLGYCRAWDKFWGNRTEGLWDDEKSD